MALIALKEAKEAEILAEERIKEAEADAKQVHLRSLQDAAAVRDQIIDAARKETSVIVAKATETAESEIDARKKSMVAECENLRNSTKNRLEKACDKVIERIVMSYGNS